MQNNDDSLQRFLFNDHPIRGAIVHLNESYQTILAQQAYPEPVARFLGEVLLASVMMAHMLKLNGELIVHLENEGPIRVLSAKCNANFEISGVALWDENLPIENITQQLQGGRLVVTLKHAHGDPYQSIVPLNHPTFTECLEAYFAQSEQLPTRFYLKADVDCGMGIFIQQMPGRGEAEELTLANTGFSKTVLDRYAGFLLNEDLLRTLFPENTIELFPQSPVIFKCSCTQARAERNLTIMPKAEVDEIFLTDSHVKVTCQFCHKQYTFSPSDVEEIFKRKVQ